MVIRQLMVFLTILIISGCGSSSKSSESNKSTSVDKNISKKVIEKREDITFTLETIDGKTLHLKEIPHGLEIKEFKGRPILLIMFGYRCPPCLREIPRLIELTKKHKDLAIVALEVQGLNGSGLKDFVELKKIDYNIVPGYDSMDFISYIQAKAGWGGSIPFLIGINKKGEVKIVQVGGLFESQLELVYNELIK